MFTPTQAVRKGDGKGRAPARGETDASVSVLDIQRLIQDASELRAVPDELDALHGLLTSVLAWREDCRQAMHQPGLRRLDDAALQELLSAGQALHVQVPELRKVEHEIDLRAWLAMLPPIPGSCEMARVQALIADADAKKLQCSQLDTIRKAHELAEITRSRVHKARGRGTSVAALESLLLELAKEKDNQKSGLVVELAEENEIHETLARCQDWSRRVCLALADDENEEASKGYSARCQPESSEAGRARPSLQELELLQEEYQPIGVYIEVCEALRRRIESGQAWKRKAFRIAPLALAPPPALAEPSTNALVCNTLEESILTVEAAVKAAVQRAASGDAAVAGSRAATQAAELAVLSLCETAATLARRCNWLAVLLPTAACYSPPTSPHQCCITAARYAFATLEATAALSRQQIAATPPPPPPSPPLPALLLCLIILR